MTRARDYRADIDGLRGIAVSLVVAYHIGLPGLRAGFIGVDVFFVISGYLIAGILVRELRSTGRIDLLAFYSRRVRRLFPALAVVLAVTTVMAAFILTPFGQIQSFAKSAVASALYVANFYFAATTGGYFDLSADAIPLLHLWSLAVEEQFYLAFPIMLWSLWQLAQGKVRVIARLMLLLTAASFGYALVQAFAGDQAGYYSPLTRAWQLLVGAMLALARGEPVSEGSGLVCRASGAMLLGLGLWIVPMIPTYPGWQALLPTVGSALFIAGGTASGGNILKAKWLVELGRVSYPWYLWHWPLISFGRTMRLGEPDLLLDAMAGAVALVFAVATYRWVEIPIARRSLRVHEVFGIGLGAMVIVAAGAAGFGLLARAAPGLWFDVRYAQAAADRSPLRKQCHQDVPFAGLTASAACRLGVEMPNGARLTVWGDSHGDHWVPMLQEHGEGVGRGSVTTQRTFSRCPPWRGDQGNLRRSDAAGCAMFQEAVFDEIATASRVGGPVGVVMGRFWIGDGLGSDDKGLRDARAAKVRSALGGTLDDLGEMRVRVLLMGPTPVFPHPAIECLARRGLASCMLSRADFDRARTRILGVLTEVAANRPWVRVIDPAEAFCVNDACYPEIQGTVMFWDSHHLTSAGARHVIKLAQPELCWLGQQRSCEPLRPGASGAPASRDKPAT
jgi:peptidoglycan/LPS O-acetylase OafA/YrhL